MPHYNEVYAVQLYSRCGHYIIHLRFRLIVTQRSSLVVSVVPITIHTTRVI